LRKNNCHPGNAEKHAGVRALGHSFLQKFDWFEMPTVS
jgi:hypothetical protein